MEKTSVLQSELQSVKQLQELEPLNKCKHSPELETTCEPLSVFTCGCFLLQGAC